ASCRRVRSGWARKNAGTWSTTSAHSRKPGNKSVPSHAMSDSPTQTVFEASYLRLLRDGVLEERIAALERVLESCTVCPRDCLNNRLNDDLAACYSGRLPIVSSYTAHFGEEPPLAGTRGAGNIFFGNCNLRCVY